MKKLLLVFFILTLLNSCSETVISRQDLERLDSRNAGINIEAVKNGDILTIELKDRGDAANVDLLRCIFQIAEHERKNKYNYVIFARKGKPKYKIQGTKFASIGLNYFQNCANTAIFTSSLQYSDNNFAFSSSDMFSAIKNLNAFMTDWSK